MCAGVAMARWFEWAELHILGCLVQVPRPRSASRSFWKVDGPRPIDSWECLRGNHNFRRRRLCSPLTELHDASDYSRGIQFACDYRSKTPSSFFFAAELGIKVSELDPRREGPLCPTPVRVGVHPCEFEFS